MRDQLRDPDNLDFRPKKDARVVDAGYYIEGVNENYVGDTPDIGPYEYGDTHYWIPGHKSRNSICSRSAGWGSKGKTGCRLNVPGSL